MSVTVAEEESVDAIETTSETSLVINEAKNDAIGLSQIEAQQKNTIALIEDRDIEVRPCVKSYVPGHKERSENAKDDSVSIDMDLSVDTATVNDSCNLMSSIVHVENHSWEDLSTDLVNECNSTVDEGTNLLQKEKSSDFSIESSHD